MGTTTFSRRQTLALLGASTAGLALGGCKPQLGQTAEVAPAKYLDTLAWQLLETSPESATSLGIDKGAHAGLRSKLGDRSGAGQRRLRRSM